MMLKSLWREPLVHFVVLGFALFVGDRLWARYISKVDYTITVKAEEIERQAIIFAGENRRQPTGSDIKALVFAYIEEQALMREAKRLGLEQDDTIIRRRLAQKMRFLIEDIDPPAVPSDAVLEDWFSDHQAEFTRVETRSFSHIYLSPEARGEGIEMIARAVLDEVKSYPAKAQGWKALGDPFMMARTFTDQSQSDMARQFGQSFAEALFALNTDYSSWQGPISSAFGLHLIRFDKVVPETQPSFAQVRDEVALAWQEQVRRRTNQNRLRDLIGQYNIDIDDLISGVDQTRKDQIKQDWPEKPDNEAP